MTYVFIKSTREFGAVVNNDGQHAAVEVKGACEGGISWWPWESLQTITRADYVGRRAPEEAPENA